MSGANAFSRAIGRLRHTLMYQTDKRLDDLEDRIGEVRRTVEEKSEASTSAIYRRIDHLAQPPGVMYISPTEVVSKMFEGTKIYLDPRDVAVTPHLVLDGI